MSEILALLKENNVLLKLILRILNKELSEDLFTNVIANMIADKLMYNNDATKTN